jgi:hypothetical protein
MATVSVNAVQFYDPSTTLQKHHQCAGIPRRKEWSRVLESYSQLRNTSKDIASKQDDHASDDSIAGDEDDEFLPVDKVIRRALHLEDSTKKATNSALTAQGTKKISLPDGSGSSMPAQSSLLGHLDGSKGTYIDSVPIQTKQLLNKAQSSQSYLTMTVMTTTTMTIIMITTMTILTARAAEVSRAI